MNGTNSSPATAIFTSYAEPDPRWISHEEAGVVARSRSKSQLADSLDRARLRCLHCSTNFDRAVMIEAARILRALHEL